MTMAQPIKPSTGHRHWIDIGSTFHRHLIDFPRHRIDAASTETRRPIDRFDRRMGTRRSKSHGLLLAFIGFHWLLGMHRGRRRAAECRLHDVEEQAIASAAAEIGRRPRP
jgi:hypothetical protein